MYFRLRWENPRSPPSLLYETLISVAVYLCVVQVSKAQDRISAVRSLLYVAHGLYKPGMTEELLEAQARENVFLLLEVGVVGGVIDLLGLELEQGRGVYEGTRSNITIADNLNLRGVCVCVCYKPQGLHRHSR